MRQLLHNSILALPMCIGGWEPDVTTGYACISCRRHSAEPVIAQKLLRSVTFNPEGNFFKEQLLNS